MIKTFVSFLTVIFTFLYSTGFAQNSAVNWALDVPVYEGGRICNEVYLDGSGIISDAEGPTGSESRMELIKFTSAEEYAQYCDLLLENGYKNVWSDVSGSVICNAFRSGEKLYYTYFTADKNEVRIIEDNNTRSFEDFGYSCCEG